MQRNEKRPIVVIVGAGFGGITAAQALARTAVDTVLIDRTNHHVFQPLLYQSATAALAAVRHREPDPRHRAASA